MTTIRFNSIETILARQRIDTKLPSTKISDYYGTNVFTLEAMLEYLSEEAYLSVQSAIKSGGKIDRQIADQVASSLKAWAMKKGATHFTHWFQPLTGSTAEKHDTFFTAYETGKGIENFNGDSLVQQEPDASSFPSGGIRNTFEARGYTAWDPSSPAFIMQIGEGKTLCIPTIFVSYTGEALDFKAPLLKALHLIETAALDVCKLFDKSVTMVTPTLGWEQEYFLIDEALYYTRPDLVMTGRTVFGHRPAKGQQLEDHYFGSIPERIYSFMMELEVECFKLGIPLKTRHNEVAPGQFEAAPYFEDVNLSVDHNQLIMDLMERIAKRHKLVALLHEKPFNGINGSGKHNNWSLMTNTGNNLLSPGRTPKTNLQFLTFFITTIKAVHDYEALLRASIASAGNDYRLGANEAPPAIISIFIGKQLTEVLHEIESRVSKGNFDESEKTILKLDIHNKIPEILLDNTDRNRTSPFAFTGNKFEMRGVGSSSSCAAPMTILNAIVGNQLIEFKKEVDTLTKKGEKRDSAILQILRRYINSSKKMLFEGDGYSSAWEKEATSRGLSNNKTTPQALKAYLSKKSKELFISNGIMNEMEIKARHEIRLENYSKSVQIESRVMAELAINHIIPATLQYQNLLTNNIKGMIDIGFKKEEMKAQQSLLTKITTNVNQIVDNVEKMRVLCKKDT